MKEKTRNTRIPGYLALMAAFLLFTVPLSAQESFNEFYKHSQTINNTGMYVLGGWAVANIASGAYGWSEYSGKRMYFYQMNLFWNIVNVSIATYALYNNYTTDINSLGQEELMNKLVSTEKILLINAGLDAGYIGAGFLLRHLSGKYPERSSLLQGYGNSIIMQGGFLLVFDVILYAILRSNRMEFLNNIDLALIPDGVTVSLNIPLY